MLEHTLSTTKAKDPGRACFLLHVRPDKLDDYVAAHQHVWTEMCDALRSAGWRHYSLFLNPDDGLVVGYFEADDTAAAMRAMDALEINTRWQRQMQQYFVQPDGTAHLLHQYFYLP